MNSLMGISKPTMQRPDNSLFTYTTLWAYQTLQYNEVIYCNQLV